MVPPQITLPVYLVNVANSMTPKPRRVQVFDVDSIEGDLSFGSVVKPLQQRRYSRFATATGSYQRHLSTKQFLNEQGCSNAIEQTPLNQGFFSSFYLFLLFFTSGVALIKSLKEVHL